LAIAASRLMHGPLPARASVLTKFPRSAPSAWPRQRRRFFGVSFRRADFRQFFDALAFV